MPFQMFLVFICIRSFSVSDGNIGVIDHTRSCISLRDISGEVNFRFNADPGEILSFPVIRGSEVFFLSSSRGLLAVDTETGLAAEVCGPGAGAPWVDSKGLLWYTFQGSLYCEGRLMNSTVPAFHASVENGVAVYTDTDDNLHILILDTCHEKVVTGYRFYSPIVLPSGAVFSPALTGEIVFLTADEPLSVVGYGEQPVWSNEHDGLFFCVSTDDGHNLTGADLWFVRPGEDPVQVTFTPDIFETKPLWAESALWYIDAVDGTVNSMIPDAL